MGLATAESLSQDTARYEASSVHHSSEISVLEEDVSQTSDI